MTASHDSPPCRLRSASSDTWGAGVLCPARASGAFPAAGGSREQHLCPAALLRLTRTKLALVSHSYV